MKAKKGWIAWSIAGVAGLICIHLLLAFVVWPSLQFLWKVNELGLGKEMAIFVETETTYDQLEENPHPYSNYPAWFDDINEMTRNQLKDIMRERQLVIQPGIYELYTSSDITQVLYTFDFRPVGWKALPEGVAVDPNVEFGENLREAEYEVGRALIEQEQVFTQFAQSLSRLSEEPSFWVGFEQVESGQWGICAQEVYGDPVYVADEAVSEEYRQCYAEGYRPSVAFVDAGKTVSLYYDVPVTDTEMVRMALIYSFTEKTANEYTKVCDYWTIDAHL